MRIVLQEGDGTRYDSAGRFRTLDRPRALSFELAPLDGRGEPLFAATYDVRLGGRTETAMTISIAVADARPEAAPALAGIEIGWRQLLENLARAVS
jgi:uncharacterized protein YndB with AHSA1/START domain